jgi:putative hydrolase
MVLIPLDEDLHVHSTFSDGVDTVAQNLATATALGLRTLGCVDHVRRDTTYVPDYVRAVSTIRATTSVAMTIGIEAKMLDASGTLDLPEAATLAGVDLVYVADHQYPDPEGPTSPRRVRDALASGERDADIVIEGLVNATIATIQRHSPAHRLVLAHLFSIVPKLGLSEARVSDELIARLVSAAADTKTIIEISERWSCPSARVVRAAMAKGVEIRVSTDSHRSSDIGKYDYVAAIAAELNGIAAAT